jgi:inositol polyphosphate 5-phosphatase INPP5B/F
MGELEDLVLGLLRSSEELRAVLKTQLVSPADASLAASTIPSRLENNTSEDTAANTRILAVVSHQDDWSVSEEGRCVPKFVSFVCSDLVV